MKKRIAKWYKFSLWTEQMVQDAVDKNIITIKDMIEILNGES